MENQVSFCNKSGNEFVSDLLNECLEIFEERENASVSDVTKKPSDSSKAVGELIISFTVSLAAGLVIEILKYCISKYKKRPDFDERFIITINDIEYTLEEIERG